MLKTIPTKSEKKEDLFHFFTLYFPEQYEEMFSEIKRNTNKTNSQVEEEIKNILKKKYNPNVIREGIIENNTLSFEQIIKLERAKSGQAPKKGEYQQYPDCYDTNIPFSFGVADNYQ